MISYYFINENHQVIPTKRGEEFNEIMVPRIIAFDMIPIAQQRPRTRVIQPKGGGKPYAHIYTVNAKHKNKLLRQIIKRKLFLVPTFAYALALYTPPKSWSGAKKDRSYGTRKVTKPDGTNILKFYEDLLEGLFMPKDQYINPTMAERYYAKTNQLIFATCPSEAVTFNMPKIIKQYFLKNDYQQ